MRHPVSLCLLLVLGACESRLERDSQWLLSDGDWGWGLGIYCMNMRDVIQINQDGFSVFDDGVIIATAESVKRSIIYTNEFDNKNKEVESVQWAYIIQAKNGIKQHFEENFTLKRRQGELLTLVAARERTRIDLTTQERIVEKNPRWGDFLTQCPAPLD